MKYIDTSAFVKYYGNPEFEKGMDKIADLIEKAKLGEEILITSIFMIGEIVSVFDRWVRTKMITEEEFSKILIRLFLDVEKLNNSGGLIIESINPLSIVFSIEHIIKHHLPINDSLHLYTALTLKPQIDQFISSDGMQLSAAEKEGFEIWNPEDNEKNK